MIPRWQREAIGELENEHGEWSMNTLFNVADLDGDGQPEIFLSGRNGHMAWFDHDATTWTRQIINEVRNQECGGQALDLTGNRRLDIINGSDGGFDELAWFEHPSTPGTPWPRHVIYKSGGHRQFHDTLIADLPGTGRSLLFSNQGQGALGLIPIPADPYQSPWPDLHWVARDCRVKGLPEEGIHVGDLDGDGQNEIVFGTSWYKFHGGTWQRHQYAQDYVTTVIELADVDGDGRLEIVLSEGDPVIYGQGRGKLGWFKPGNDITEPWLEHRVADNLNDGHSLQIADLCGHGFQDLIVGEIGNKDTLETEPPRLMLFENNGRGQFSRHLIDQGYGAHHARLADFYGTGRLDIASRALHGPDKWKVFVWRNLGNT